MSNLRRSASGAGGRPPAPGAASPAPGAASPVVRAGAGAGAAPAPNADAIEEAGAAYGTFLGGLVGSATSGAFSAAQTFFGRASIAATTVSAWWSRPAAFDLKKFSAELASRPYSNPTIQEFINSDIAQRAPGLLEAAFKRLELGQETQEAKIEMVLRSVIYLDHYAKDTGVPNTLFTAAKSEFMKSIFRFLYLRLKKFNVEAKLNAEYIVSNSQPAGGSGFAEESLPVQMVKYINEFIAMEDELAAKYGLVAAARGMKEALPRFRFQDAPEYTELTDVNEIERFQASVRINGKTLKEIDDKIIAERHAGAFGDDTESLPSGAVRERIQSTAARNPNFTKAVDGLTGVFALPPVELANVLLEKLPPGDGGAMGPSPPRTAAAAADDVDAAEDAARAAMLSDSVASSGLNRPTDEAVTRALNASGGDLAGAGVGFFRGSKQMGWPEAAAAAAANAASVAANVAAARNQLSAPSGNRSKRPANRNTNANAPAPTAKKPVQGGGYRRYKKTVKKSKSKSKKRLTRGRKSASRKSVSRRR